jgi:drug/metabolite transporter (DMT)-like permease
MTKLSRKWIADFSLLLVAFVWGSTFVVVQSAIETLPPFTFNGLRFLLAGIVLFICMVLFEKSEQWKKDISKGIILGIFLFIAYAFQTFGLLFTTPAKSGFLTGLSVVMVPFLIYFFSKQKPSLSAVFGSILAGLGLFFLTAGHAQNFNIGDVLTIICAFGFAFHIVYTDRFTHHSSILILTTIQLLTVSILSFIGALLFENWMAPFQTNEFWSLNVIAGLLVTALLATSAAFYIQTFSQRYTSPSRVAIILTMEPVFAALCSYLWIGEQLTFYAVMGGIFILIGMLCAEIPIPIVKKPRKKRTA